MTELTNSRGNSFKLYRGSSLALKNIRQAYASRPIRCPHYTASEQGILGRLKSQSHGPNRPDPLRPFSDRLVLTPGEIHLANHGVLVLTDLPEFRRAVLERLAVMWLSGYAYHATMLSGALTELAYPLSFDIVATAEHCPCASPDRKNCRCSLEAKQRFEDRIMFFVTLLEDGQPH